MYGLRKSRSKAVKDSLDIVIREIHPLLFAGSGGSQFAIKAQKINSRGFSAFPRGASSLRARRPCSRIFLQEPAGRFLQPICNGCQFRAIGMCGRFLNQCICLTVGYIDAVFWPWMTVQHMFGGKTYIFSDTTYLCHNDDDLNRMTMMMSMIMMTRRGRMRIVMIMTSTIAMTLTIIRETGERSLNILLASSFKV